MKEQDLKHLKQLDLFHFASLFNPSTLASESPASLRAQVCYSHGSIYFNTSWNPFASSMDNRASFPELGGLGQTMI